MGPVLTGTSMRPVAAVSRMVVGTQRYVQMSRNERNSERMIVVELTLNGWITSYARWLNAMYGANSTAHLVNAVVYFVQILLSFQYWLFVHIYVYSAHVLIVLDICGQTTTEDILVHLLTIQCIRCSIDSSTDILKF